MNIIYVLIPIAIILVLVAIGVFFWAVKNDQFEDLERQGLSILFDDDLASPNQEPQTEEQPQALKKHNKSIDINNNISKDD
ncbi:cbb3-type cytochrome oxidase assembly protein CcoS [Aliiglaciecola litoralis]|uniref:Cytochrome oxidase maturation protein, cbb3-type n=1 Tax=Aliiglaciecola litoralis TaxID=582857 RepID=A0ABN1LC73_9ALTE